MFPLFLSYCTQERLCHNFLNMHLPLIDYEALQTTTRLYEEQIETALPEQ